MSDVQTGTNAQVPAPAPPPADQELGLDDILTFDASTVVKASRESAAVAVPADTAADAGDGAPATAAIAVVEPPAPVEPVVPAEPLVPVVVPDAVVPEHLVSTDCPNCGTPGTVDFGRRESAAFCGKCDFPLFWSRDRVVLAANGAADERGLRRLPGTAGRTALASMLCPSCHEPNPSTGVTCLRCGADLYPVEPEPVVVVPEPVVGAPPPPEPANRWWLPYLIAGVAAIVALAVVLIVLYT